MYVYYPVCTANFPSPPELVIPDDRVDVREVYDVLRGAPDAAGAGGEGGLQVAAGEGAAVKAGVLL